MAEKNENLLTGHNELAVDLCRALRIPIDMMLIEGFELRVFGSEIATLKVTHYVGESQANNLVKTLSTFNFELKPEERDPLLDFRPTESNNAS